MLRNKSIFQISTLICLRSITICNLLAYLRITSSLSRGWVCHLKLLLALASTFILGSESRGNRDHILLSQIETSRCVASYDSLGYGGGIRPRLHTGRLGFKLKSYITTDGQSASLFWNKVPIWGLRPDLSYCRTVAGHECTALYNFHAAYIEVTPSNS
jgi:hypothetical protein